MRQAGDEAPELARYCRAQMARQLPRLGLALAAAALLWWPLDPLVFPTRPDVVATLGRVRLWGALALGALWLVSRAGPWVERWAPWLGAVAMAAGPGLVARQLAAVGGPDTPWFHLLYAALLLPVALLVPRGPRVAATCAVGLAVWAGYFVGTPWWDAPMHAASASYLAFGVVLSVLLGDGLYALVCANFAQGRRLARQQAELVALNEGLEARIAAQTDTLRRLARRAERLRDEERRWMARELHDHLGQELTALRYTLDFARRGAEGVAARRLDEALRLLDRTGATMRRIFARLHPRVLEEMGLPAAARWLAEDVGRRTGLAAEVEVEPPDLVVAPGVAAPLFGVLQEAVTNVARHARARRLSVSLRREGDHLALAVGDDGVGLPPASERGGGLGLVGIRERVAALGGTAAWSAAPGGGTLLTARVPLPPEEPA